MIKSTVPTIKEVNAETGNEIVRDMNADEIAQLDKDRAEIAAQRAKFETDAIAKAGLLDRLGITAEEAALLLS
jgi:hypothetical protein